MKVVAFVPIKLNSERLPGKNIKKLRNGQPLISYILNTLCEVKRLGSIDEAYVYCSDESITSYLPSEIKFLKRSKYLDLSETAFNEVLIKFSQDVNADIYVLTHATAPFISSNTIINGINAVKNEGYDSALAVERLQEFLWYEDKPLNYSPDNIPRTQDLTPYFKETCGMYVYTRNVIADLKRRIGNKPKLIEVSNYESIDINNPEDFELADAINTYRQLNK